VGAPGRYVRRTPPVESFDKGRGYEYAKNAYVPVDDDELDAIAIESDHTIEINDPHERPPLQRLIILPSRRIGQVPKRELALRNKQTSECAAMLAGRRRSRSAPRSDRPLPS
jgi:hypothetical protein